MLVALASCQASERPPPELVVVTPAPAASASATASATATAPAVSQHVAPPPSGASPAELCLAHHDRLAGTSADPRKRSPQRTENRPLEVSRGAKGPVLSAQLRGDRVVCQILWAEETTEVDVTVQPRCCPPHTSPCNSYVTKGLERRQKVERVSLDESGRPLEDELVQYVTTPSQPQMPYCGRRFEGFARLDGASGAAARLVEMAALEAASITAFERLERELALHGAPALASRARDARCDEVRHARVTGRLARARGAQVKLPARRRLPARALFPVLLENAVEGCVRETFGAATAMFQAARARDPEVRAALASIAEDEARHAELAWDVHEELGPRLSPVERRRIEEAMRAARAGLGCPSDAELGLPDEAAARTLIDALFDQLL